MFLKLQKNVKWIIKRTIQITELFFHFPAAQILAK